MYVGICVCMYVLCAYMHMYMHVYMLASLLYRQSLASAKANG